jgi:hypothetical protein
MRSNILILLTSVAKIGQLGRLIGDYKLQGPETWRDLQGNRPINRRLQGNRPINR